MMEKSFYDFAPDAQVLLALEPEEVRGIVLEYLNTLPESSANLNRHNFGLAATFSKYPQEYRERVSRAVMEGWSWLERQGLIAPRPSGGGMGGDWISVTRKGRGIKSRKDIEAYQHANLLPRQLLHRERRTLLYLRSFGGTTTLQSSKRSSRLRSPCGLRASMPQPTTAWR